MMSYIVRWRKGGVGVRGAGVRKCADEDDFCSITALKRRCCIHSLEPEGVPEASLTQGGWGTGGGGGGRFGC